MPRSPLPPFPEQYLQSWRFDEPDGLIAGEWDTLGTLNLQWRESWSGNALSMAGSDPSLFLLAALAKDGRLNLSLEAGTLRFYFAPDWSSGAPVGDARLLEFGAWSANEQAT